MVTNTAVGNSTATNSGSVGGTMTTNTAAGNSTATNSGSVGGSMTTNTAAGNSTTTNSGSVGGSMTTNTAAGNSTTTNSGSVGGSMVTNTAVGNSTTTNSGSVGGTMTTNTAVGDSTATNAGSVVGPVTVNTGGGTATLNNLAGSRIGGLITVSGTTANLNFLGGNYLYTLGSLAGVAINTNGAPFVVSGNTVAVLDPTAFALADRSLMMFTGMVGSAVQDRFKGMAPVGAAGGGALGFAGGASPDQVDGAHAAFAGIPALNSQATTPSSLAMAYSSAGRPVFKGPVGSLAPVYDTVVWASGFGGIRHQGRTSNLQKADDVAFGGVIGFDRQVNADLRLGLIAGGGSGRQEVEFDINRIDTDYIFAGGYGRWDRGSHYFDVSVTGGSLSNKSTRTVANNNVPGGLETATASYDGWFLNPDLTYGLRIPMQNFLLTPKARVRYVAGWLDAYTETGSQQGLAVGRRSFGVVEERLGVELSSVLPAAFGGTVKTVIEVSGVGLQRVGDGTINTVLLGQNLAFVTPGTSTAWGGAAAAMVDWRPTATISIFAAVEGTVMSDHSATGTARAGVRVRF